MTTIALELRSVAAQGLCEPPWQVDLHPIAPIWKLRSISLED
jgi:hypothetical protein